MLAAARQTEQQHSRPPQGRRHMEKALELRPLVTPDRASAVNAVAQASDDAAASGVRAAPPVDGPPQRVPATLKERLALARERLRHAAENGVRIRVYEVALDLDMSEFHFARQFRATYGYSPHVYYDEVRATCARALLRDGWAQGPVARRIGLRRPAELRALLARRRGFAETP